MLECVLNFSTGGKVMLIDYWETCKFLNSDYNDI